jgi:ABC-type protease/lipase transport system fused ATPase/permease subunit
MFAMPARQGTHLPAVGSHAGSESRMVADAVGLEVDGMAAQRLLAPLLRLTRFPLMALGLISLVSNLMMLTGPLFMLQIYDRVLASRSVPTLVALTLLVVGLYGFYALLEWLRSRTGLFNALDWRLERSVSRDMIFRFS